MKRVGKEFNQPHDSGVQSDIAVFKWRVAALIWCQPQWALSQDCCTMLWPSVQERLDYKGWRVLQAGIGLLLAWGSGRSTVQNSQEACATFACTVLGPGQCHQSFMSEYQKFRWILGTKMFLPMSRLWVVIGLPLLGLQFSSLGLWFSGHPPVFSWDEIILMTVYIQGVCVCMYRTHAPTGWVCL